MTYQQDSQTEVTEAPPPPVSKELKKRWSYFIRKVYETDPLVCPSVQVSTSSRRFSSREGTQMHRMQLISSLIES